MNFFLAQMGPLTKVGCQPPSKSRQQGHARLRGMPPWMPQRQHSTCSKRDEGEGVGVLHLAPHPPLPLGLHPPFLKVTPAAGKARWRNHQWWPSLAAASDRGEAYNVK
jgi:hypothetical protein